MIRTVGHQEAGHFLLDQGQVGFRLQDLFHPPLVACPVHLGPGRHNGGTLGGVEHTKLDHMSIGQPAHLSAQGVNFPDHLALGCPANIGVARQIGQAVQGHGKEDDPAAQAGGGQGRLTACMAGTDHNHVCLAGQEGARS